MINCNFKNNPNGKFIGNEFKYVLECLNSEKKNKKNFVGLLEKKFSKKMKCRYAIAFNSGTTLTKLSERLQSKSLTVSQNSRNK